MPKKPAHKYKVRLTINMVYLSNEVHDQGFYHMFAEILQTAQMEYKKYRFELDKFETLEQPKD